MKSIYDGLDECVVLMQFDQSPSTLVLSSNRSEALKGFVVRQGKNITKAVGVPLCAFLRVFVC